MQQQLATGAAACGLIFDGAMQQLHMQQGHLEHPARVHELHDQLLAQGLHARCTQLSPRQATDEELLRCHSRAHIDKVDSLHSSALSAHGQPAELCGDAVIITNDLYCTSHSSAAARSAAGCSIQAVESVLSGAVQRAFALVRPPGHHATSDELMGFCFFNNVAVAAAAALEHPGVERVLILDWDVHAGNGTQQIHYSDPRVLVVSLHRRDAGFYPADCGAADEIGAGAGRGFNINVPWSSKGMGDGDYLAAFDLLLAPVLRQFAPQLVLVSAGFDAADGDFLGRCHVSPAGFAAMTARLLDWCAHSAAGRLVAVLEGGYVPSIVADCACEVVRVLLGEQPPLLPRPAALCLHKSTRAVLAKVDAIQRQHWLQLAQQPPFAARFQAYSTALQLQRLSISISLHAPAGHGTRAAVRAAAAAAAAGAPPGPAAAAAMGGSSSGGGGGRSKQLASCAPPLWGSRSSSSSSSSQRGSASTQKPAASQPRDTGSGAAAPGPVLPGTAAASSGAAVPDPVLPSIAAASSGARPGGLKIRIKLKKPGAAPAVLAGPPALPTAAGAAAAGAAAPVTAAVAQAAPSTAAVAQAALPAAVTATEVPPAVPAAAGATIIAAATPAPAAPGAACSSRADVALMALPVPAEPVVVATAAAAQAGPSVHAAGAAVQAQQAPTVPPGAADADAAARLAELLIGLGLAEQGSQHFATGAAGAAAAMPPSTAAAAAGAGGCDDASAAAAQHRHQATVAQLCGALEQLRMRPASSDAAAATWPPPAAAPAKQPQPQPLERGAIWSELLAAAAVSLPDDDA